jgi:hypothetical protein
MPNIFKANIAKEIGKAMGPLVFPLTLTKIRPSTRGDLTGGVNSIPDTFSGKGFIDNYRDSRVDGSIVKVGDRVITILGASMGAIPEPNDTVFIEDREWTIVKDGVKRDPAGATYECQVR